MQIIAPAATATPGQLVSGCAPRASVSIESNETYTASALTVDRSEAARTLANPQVVSRRVGASLLERFEFEPGASAHDQYSVVVRRASTRLYSRLVRVPSMDDSELTSTPYLDALVALRDIRNPARMMVPGHKGGRAISPRLAAAFGPAAEGVLGLDIPLHVRGIDVGPPDPPPIVSARKLAARAWGARTTHFVVGGGSQANHIVCLGLSILVARPGRRLRVAVQRNVHQSVIYGLILADADVVWLNPEIDAEFGIQHCVAPEALDAVLARLGHDQLDAVMVVSPTYYGAVSDVAKLADVIRARRAPDETLLVVDEAWGAHFPFNKRFPVTAVRCGADIVISSTHKILGSLTQSAMLHITPHVSDRLDQTVEQAIEKARNLVKTTSPSSLLMASLDAARAYASGEGGELLGRAAASADRVRKAARDDQLPGMKVVDDSVVTRNASVAAFDPLRVTLDVRGTGLTGREIQEALWRPAKGGVEIEFCTDELVVLLFGIGDGAADSADRVVDALKGLSVPARSGAPGTKLPEAATRALFGRISAPKTKKTLREGFLGSTQARMLKASDGYICAEIVAPYPPGIPVVMPGELLTPEIVEYLLHISQKKNKTEFSDCRDPHLREIQVLVGGGTIEPDESDAPGVERKPPPGGH